MLKYLILSFTAMFYFSSVAQDTPYQDTLPFRHITEYPASFSAESMVSRMIDGLGFRYYWATEGLRAEDLCFRPSTEARSSEETIDHIMGLSIMILKSVKNEPNISSGEETSPKTFIEKRKITLDNLNQARLLLTSGTIQVEDIKIIFIRKDGQTELPIWNLINGPIADAIWHTGQVVTFRRSSGNPFDSKVNVMMGKLR